MSETPFANTPEPPYVAVIFTSTRTDDDRGYAAMAEAMNERRGRDVWYQDYRVRVATVERDYGMSSSDLRREL